MNVVSLLIYKDLYKRRSYVHPPFEPRLAMADTKRNARAV